MAGTDRNRNGLTDDDPSGSQTSDTLRGWADYLTVYGRELDLDSTGVLRTNVNDTASLSTLYQQLTTRLGSPLADYIMAYKMFSVSNTSSNSSERVGAFGRGRGSSGIRVGVEWIRVRGRAGRGRAGSGSGSGRVRIGIGWRFRRGWG